MKGAGAPLSWSRRDRSVLQAVLGVGAASLLEEQSDRWPQLRWGHGLMFGVSGLRGGQGRDLVEGYGYQVLVVQATGRHLPRMLSAEHVDILTDDFDCTLSPFVGGTDEELEAAYGWLLLVVTLLDDRSDESARGLPCSGRRRARSAALEYAIMRRISRLVGVRLGSGASTYSFSLLRSWLWQVAARIAAGERLRFCTTGLMNNARRLAAVALWMAPSVPSSTRDRLAHDARALAHHSVRTLARCLPSLPLLEAPLARPRLVHAAIIAIGMIHP